MWYNAQNKFGLLHNMIQISVEYKVDIAPKYLFLNCPVRSFLMEKIVIK